jgi:hypothetical protein
MPKPILVVNYCVSGISMGLAVRNLKSLKDVVEGSGVNEEYYTFILPILGDSYVQVFYDKDIDDSSFNNLRDLIDQRFQEFEDGIAEDGMLEGGEPLFDEQPEKRKWFSLLRRR